MKILLLGSGGREHAHEDEELVLGCRWALLLGAQHDRGLLAAGELAADQGQLVVVRGNLVTRDHFEHSSVGFGLGGSPGHGSSEK